ncbi:hypothetical protein OFO10_07965 [Campylobacter sp. VBCF_06 NA8]|uniref:hypothetical protein n=1 Tax=unclassified Campylobacter TaxID=2593542 RepID=UPI0022E9D9ED|nr:MULTISPECIES: hypothetical protein [unclassified Campylobacter]MDA3042448.1 hypothetical protein [Campylobacter sp. JMF_09 ED2]MDA3044738.1 hypothetical protein [Campylobacter sp. JMF_07 ED4]MDA3047090.1 hypothetical protein [Campylobacter sp. VBCF_06 NA8]MDA3063140.1 hypothetical protein [Campylobacter sp. JMF_11 EL3]MDA3071715.1 hypothetical protein [Campylobacter sp. VBCF_03 NA9]
MENRNFKNDIFNKNKNLRDYDKEPLILRDYSKGIKLHGVLNLIFFFIAFLFISAIQSHIEFGEFDELIKKIFILCFIFVGFLTISYMITINSKERYVSLTSDMKAIYYDNDLQIRKIYSLLGNKEFSSFLYQINRLKNIFGFILIGIFLFTLDAEIIFIFIFVSFLAVIYDILFRMFVYRKSNKNLTNFWKYSQKFVIDIGWIDDIRFVTAGATICFFNQKDHDLLKEYFLSLFHINLDTDIKGIEAIKIF